MLGVTWKLKRGRVLIVTLMLSCCFLAALPGRAAAMSFGAYVDVAGGSGEFEYDSINYEIDADVSSGAAGLVLDTNPLGNSIFNYRMNAGFDSQSIEFDDGIDLDMNGIYVDNIFCFTFIHKPKLRWWGGPLVRLGFYSGETDIYYNRFSERVEEEHDYFQFGIGFATGVNIKAGESLVLAPSAGVRIIGAGGTVDFNNLDAPWFSFEDDIYGIFGSLFLNFSLLF